MKALHLQVKILVNFLAKKKKDSILCGRRIDQHLRLI